MEGWREREGGREREREEGKGRGGREGEGEKEEGEMEGGREGEGRDGGRGREKEGEDDVSLIYRWSNLKGGTTHQLPSLQLHPPTLARRPLVTTRCWVGGRPGPHMSTLPSLRH